ncbi:MAG: hypothetical protein ABJE95_03200 [Byssovorax sp.]
MLTIDEMLRAYDDGDITRNELFGHLLTQLDPVQLETVRERLSQYAGCLKAFEQWVDDVASGAELFSGSRRMRISEDTRLAIAHIRDRMRAERYTKLANRMQHWKPEEHAFEPDDIEPFHWTDIEPLLEEAA